MDNNVATAENITNIQIKILEEKLAFAQKQLDEKDRQIEHYKGLVKTMQELLDGRPQARVAPVKATKTSPPGFQEKQLPANSLRNHKEKKFHSFHAESTTTKETSDLSEQHNQMSLHRSTNSPSLYQDEEDEDFAEYERELSRRHLDYENDIMTRSIGGPMSSAIKKSKSITALSQFSEDSKFNPAQLRVSIGPIPTKTNKSPVKEINSNNQLSKLKKSQSMSSMYTALEENKIDLKFPDLEQMTGQIYQLSKYQQGCRFLQKKLDEDPKNTPVILKELYDHFVELMTDPFGNYLFTKLVERCDPQQRDTIIQRILPEISTTAFDMYGTQSLQKIFPLLSDAQIEAVVGALKQSALALIKHNKANYLIQYCLDKLRDDQKQWIYDTVCTNMEEVSKDRVGCVIVKRCIDHATETDEVLNSLIRHISECMVSLVQDPFGNYVVQHVLQKWPYHDESRKMIRKLVGNVTDLCIQKFSSNVIEKCLKVADEETRGLILAEITESHLLPQLLNDRFANFVIQTALDVADPDQRSKLVKNILPHLGKHYSPYTKRLQKKILQV